MTTAGWCNLLAAVKACIQRMLVRMKRGHAWRGGLPGELEFLGLEVLAC